MDKDIAPVGRIEDRIYVLRGKRVMLDSDLAALYGVTTGRLNEQVRRNADRFLEDFSFHVKDQELAGLMSQIAISNRIGVRNSALEVRLICPTPVAQHHITQS